MKKLKVFGVIIGSILIFSGCSEEKTTTSKTIAKERDFIVRVEETKDGDIVKIEKVFDDEDDSGKRVVVFWEDEDWYEED